MIDCAFCGPSGLGWDIDKRNRQEFTKLIEKLGRHQLASGIVTISTKPRIRKWIEVSEQRRQRADS